MLALYNVEFREGMGFFATSLCTFRAHEMRNFLVMVRATSCHHKGTGELDVCQILRCCYLITMLASIVPRPETTRRSPCQQSCDGLSCGRGPSAGH